MYIKVRVVPKAKREQIKRINDQTFELTVKEPAERNLANNRIKEMISEFYGVEPKAVRLVSGHHSGSKILDVKMDV
ncbi:MAG: DUF167 domain-containing protein [Candidatus Pacebacteria bacterium]|nr:DUF167 domain-containing protein [Candidatus Paceibacterota bacterium]